MNHPLQRFAEAVVGSDIDTCRALRQFPERSVIDQIFRAGGHRSRAYELVADGPGHFSPHLGLHPSSRAENVEVLMVEFVICVAVQTFQVDYVDADAGSVGLPDNRLQRLLCPRIHRPSVGEIENRPSLCNLLLRPNQCQNSRIRRRNMLVLSDVSSVFKG